MSEKPKKRKTHNRKNRSKKEKPTNQPKTSSINQQGTRNGLPWKEIPREKKTQPRQTTTANIRPKKERANKRSRTVEGKEKEEVGDLRGLLANRLEVGHKTKLGRGHHTVWSTIFYCPLPNKQLLLLQRK